MEVERCSGTIVSIPFDHHHTSGLYYHAPDHEDHVEYRPAILRLHGILGNFLEEARESPPGDLGRFGYSSLILNTLLANIGLFYGFGIFDDAMSQIDAACDFLRGVGFKKIVILGHGLGSCMAVRYAALRNNPSKYQDISGVIALATPYSMPETVRRRWERFGSEPSYDEVYGRARRVSRPGSGEEPAGDRTIVVKRAHGYSRRPEHTDIYTLKTWWALAGPEAEGAMTCRHIGEVRVPVLLIHALRDEFIERSEFEDLGRIARAAGNGDVTLRCLDTVHTFDGKYRELGKTVVRWLNDRFGRPGPAPRGMQR